MLLAGLGIDLTHRCNLNCGFCWKFVENSKYEMTIHQVRQFCKYFGYLSPRKLRIAGGEPLAHPEFKTIIPILAETFFFSALQIVTNGMLLDESMFYKGVQYVVTPYPENEEIRKQFGDRIIVFPRPLGYFDRNHDPNLSEKRARAKHKKCGYKQIRVIGDNVYDCCHAQTMERMGKCPSVHVKVKYEWEEEFKNKENWEECVHCFVGDGGKKIIKTDR